MKTRWPVFKKRPDGYLVYVGDELWTKECVDREEASRIFELITALNSSARVQIRGVHALDHKSQKELSNG